MDYRFVRTTCPYCGCGCQMLLEVCNGRLVGTLPLKSARMNQGKLCIKGWNAHQFVHSPERLTQPLVRMGGKASGVIVGGGSGRSGLRPFRDKGQAWRSQPGFFSSALTTNEENYLVQKLCRAGFGTNNVDHSPVSDTLPRWQVLPLRSEVVP